MSCEYTPWGLCYKEARGQNYRCGIVSKSVIQKFKKLLTAFCRSFLQHGCLNYKEINLNVMINFLISHPYTMIVKKFICLIFSTNTGLCMVGHYMLGSSYKTFSSVIYEYSL